MAAKRCVKQFWRLNGERASYPGNDTRSSNGGPIWFQRSAVAARSEVGRTAADLIGRRIVFNPGSYRSIAGFNFEAQIIFFKAFTDPRRVRPKRLAEMSTTKPTYTDLLLTHKPNVPRTDADHERLVAILEFLTLDGRRLSTRERMFVDLVTVLVLEYERRTLAARASDPVKILRYLAEEHDLRQVDLAGAMGTTRAYINQLFTGRRAITTNVAEKLAKVFQVTPETFLGARRVGLDLGSGRDFR